MTRARALATIGLGLAFTACGPSFQAIYEGNARFEHCYATDDDPNVPMQRKSDCWLDWTKHYTYGQTRDRLEYATMRYRALSRVPSAPTDEAMMGAAPGEGSRSSSITAPAPTSAFAPPPKTMEEHEGGAPPAPAPPAPPVAPTVDDNDSSSVDAGKRTGAIAPPKSDCVDTCGTTWHACTATCNDQACAACDKTYGKCVKKCF